MRGRFLFPMTLRLYILREIVPPTVVSTVFFTFVLLLAQMLEMANTLVQAGVSGALLAEMLGIVVVTLLSFTVPMGVLLGTLIGVGRLTAENEILAVRVGGISPLRVVTPILALAFLLAAGQLGANMNYLPSLVRKVGDIVYQMQFHVLTNLKPQRIYDDFESQGTTMALVYGERGEGWSENAETPFLPMKNINMRAKVDREAFFPEGEEAIGPDFEFLIFADRGEISGDLESGELQLVLENGSWLPVDVLEGAETTETMVIRFDRFENRMGSRQIDRLSREAHRQMSVAELAGWMMSPPEGTAVGGEKMPREWQRYFAARNELITRFTVPLATFFFALIAVPLAMEVRPRAKSLAVVMAAGLLLAYYALMTFGASVGANGASWPVAVGSHLLPNVLTGTAGFMLLIRQLKR